MPKADSPRMRRVNEAVKEVVAERVGGLKDPRLGFVTITDVRTSTDLSVSEIFYTVLPDTPESRESTAAGLASAAGLLRHDVGARLRMRRTPDLHFVHDPVPERGRRIETLLNQAREDHPQDADS